MLGFIKKHYVPALTGMALLLMAVLFYNRDNLTDSVYSPDAEKMLPIYCVEQDKPIVALSFDAAWGNEDTPRILEILKKNNVNVTFFMTGGWVIK